MTNDVRWWIVLDHICRLKQIVKLVYDTIREPHVTLPVPLPIARLLAMPARKAVPHGAASAHYYHLTHSLINGTVPRHAWASAAMQDQAKFFEGA